MRGLVRVQCEADDCGALLEVQLPEDGESSSPFIIVRCGQCQRLLEVWLPSSSAAAAAPPARSPTAYTPAAGPPAHQPSSYPKHAAQQPAPPRPPPASVDMQGLHSQCPQPEPPPMLHSRPGASPAPPHYPSTGTGPPAAMQQYQSPYYAHPPPSSGASTHMQGWGAATAAGHNSSGSSTAAMYPASVGQQQPMHMAPSQHPSTAITTNPAMPGHLASGVQAGGAAGYWSPASSTQQTGTPHRAGERSTPTGEGSGSGGSGAGTQHLPHSQPQGVQASSDPTIQHDSRDRLDGRLMAAGQHQAVVDVSGQHSFHAAAQACGSQQGAHPTPIDRWRATATPSWPAGMMHDEAHHNHHHPSNQQIEHSVGGSTDAHHGSNPQPDASWSMPPATISSNSAVEHRLSVCMPQQGLTAQQASELLGNFEGSSWTPHMGALTALLLGDGDDDDMLVGLERLLSNSWNDIEADQLLGQAASIAAAGDEPGTPTAAAAAAAGGSQALMHSLPPGVKLQPMRKQRKRKNGTSPSPGPLNPYSEFMRAEMRRLREAHPGLNHRAALRMAATNWASARPVLGAVFPSPAGVSQISTPETAPTPASTAITMPAGTTAQAAPPGRVGAVSTVSNITTSVPAAAASLAITCVDVAAATAAAAAAAAAGAGAVAAVPPATNGGSSTASSGTGWTAAALIPTVQLMPEDDVAASSTPAVAFVSGAGQRGTPLHSLMHLRQVLSDLLAQSQPAANCMTPADGQQQSAAEQGTTQLPSQSFTLRSMSNDVSMDAPLSSLAGLETVSDMED